MLSALSYGNILFLNNYNCFLERALLFSPVMNEVTGTADTPWLSNVKSSFPLYFLCCPISSPQETREAGANIPSLPHMSKARLCFTSGRTRPLKTDCTLLTAHIVADTREEVTMGKLL